MVSVWLFGNIVVEFYPAAYNVFVVERLQLRENNIYFEIPLVIKKKMYAKFPEKILCRIGQIHV